MGKSIVDLDHFDTQIDPITIKRKKKVNYKAEDYNPNKGLPCKKSMELYQLGLQVTENCNLRCTYCYQMDKVKRSMTLEECKKAIDMILDGDEDKYCRFVLKNPFCFHIIGGEPLLEDELVYKSIKYFDEKLKEKHIDIDWFIWIPSNGIPYFREYAQKMVKEYIDKLDLVISMDGCKECHNACRLFPDGTGSYDASRKAFDDLRKRKEWNYPETKFTMSPANIQYYSESIIEWLEEGMYKIYANWTLEDDYTYEDARKYYYEAKKVIDYIVDHDLEDKVSYSVFERSNDMYIDNWAIHTMCGASGHNLAVIPGGEIYPCVRYAATSLEDDVEPFIIGTLDDGIGYDDKTLNNFNHMIKDRKHMSSFKCYNCPISQSCNNCLGNDYNRFRENMHRCVGVCNINIADNLARVYGINKIYRKKEKTDPNYFFKSFHNLVPDSWALNIIDRNELDMIKYLAKEKELIWTVQQ